MYNHVNALNRYLLFKNIIYKFNLIKPNYVIHLVTISFTP